MGSSSGWRFDRSQNGRATRLGWTYVHVAVDEHSRLAYVEELSDEHPPTTIGVVRRAIDFYAAAHGVRISRLLTDNGTPTDHEPSPPQPTSSSSDTCATCPTHQGPRQGRSDGQDPYQQMGINRWAYAKAYDSDAERSRALRPFIDFYNHERPHGGLDGARPIDRVRQ
jgi:transposase InsO family protein